MILRFSALCLLTSVLCLGQAPTSPPTTVSLGVNSTTGVIAVPVSAATFRSANSLQPLGLGFADYTGLQYWDHRNNPNIYPEETLEGYRASVAAGARFVEMDCVLLADGALGVMHDDTVDRTTTSSGDTANYSSASWTRLVVDASSFLGGGWPDTRPPLATEVLSEFGNRVPILIEAKVTGTGQKIVDLLARYGVAKSHVIVNSFSAPELTPAIAAGYTTSINYSSYSGTPTPATLLATGYNWVAVPDGTSTAQCDALRAVGLKVAVYTINTQTGASTYATHADAIYSNDAIYLRGTARRTSDPFASQTWYHGQQASNSSGDGGGRGAFYASDYWGYNMAASNTWVGALQGWASPIGGAATFSGTVVISFTVKFESAFADTRFAWIALSNKDIPLDTDISPSNSPTGYLFMARKNGTVGIWWWNAGVGSTSLIETTGSAIADGASANYTVTVTPTDLTIQRTDVSTTASIAHTAGGRPSYLHAGAKGVYAKFKDMVITGP